MTATRRSVLHFPFGVIFALIAINCGNRKHRNQISAENALIHRTANIADTTAKRLFEKGLTFVASEDYEEANKRFLMADSISPNTPVILNALGNNAMMAHKPGAEKYYKHALGIDSEYIQSYSNYGWYLSTQNRPEEAVPILLLGIQKANERLEDPSILYLNLSEAYSRMGLEPLALSYIDSVKRTTTSGTMLRRAYRFQRVLQGK